MELEQVKELCVSTMYWEMHMRDKLSELIEQNTYVRNAYYAYFGKEALEILDRRNANVTFSEFYYFNHHIVRDIREFDEEGGAANTALFNVFEDVLFLLGEATAAYERVSQLVQALYDGDEIGNKTLVDMIGADIAGYRAE